MFLIFSPLPIEKALWSGIPASGAENIVALDVVERWLLIIGVGWPTKQGELQRNGWIGARSVFFS